MPADAQDATEAMRIADQRMYQQKHGRESSAARQSKNVLLRAIVERSPGLVAPPHRRCGSRGRRRAACSGCRSTRSSRCATPPSCTTSARSRSPTRSCRSRTPVRRGVELRAQAHPDRLADHQRRARAHTRCQARPLKPRALGRRRLPRPARRRRDPDRLPNRRRLRRPGGDGHRPPVPGGRRPARRSRRARSAAPEASSIPPSSRP